MKDVYKSNLSIDELKNLFMIKNLPQKLYIYICNIHTHSCTFMATFSYFKWSCIT